MLHLEEGDVVALRRGAFEVFNAAERFEGGPPAPAKARALQTLNMEVAQIMKVRLCCIRGVVVVLL